MIGLGRVWNRKPRQFDYKPRYFDPEKEQRELRKKQVLGVDHNERHLTDEERKAAYVPGKYLNTSIKARRGIGSTKMQKKRKSNLALIVALVVIGLITWWIVTTDIIRLFLERWLGA
ncbi:MAG: hypothetical protein FWE10_04990 [Rikenellaceae bacterium]|nr:hypothetical protein [Rikenellaceae bacterium]MCL2692412.1 hypothetical protein [Rikenellaceae bacterium]